MDLPPSTSSDDGSNSRETEMTRGLPQSPLFNPNVIWQQNKTHVIFKILLPPEDLGEFEVTLLFGKIFFFKTLNSGKKYKLYLSLFAEVDQNVDYKKFDSYILVKLRKLKQENWPRLRRPEKNVDYIMMDFGNNPEDWDEKRSNK